MSKPSVEPCDYCTMMNRPHTCEGADVHCRRGSHCIVTSEVCCIDRSHDDHGRKCCHCKKEMPGE